MKLVTDLVREGELTLAKIMRRKVLEKCDPNQRPVEDIQILAGTLKSPKYVNTAIDLCIHMAYGSYIGHIQTGHIPEKPL